MLGIASSLELYIEKRICDGVNCTEVCHMSTMNSEKHHSEQTLWPKPVGSQISSFWEALLSVKPLNP